MIIWFRILSRFNLIESDIWEAVIISIVVGLLTFFIHPYEPNMPVTIYTRKSLVPEIIQDIQQIGFAPQYELNNERRFKKKTWGLFFYDGIKIVEEEHFTTVHMKKKYAPHFEQYVR